MPYKNETAIVPVTAPVSSVVNPIGGILEKLGSNWWILIVLFFLFFNKGFGKGHGGMNNFGGFSGEKLMQTLVPLIQPALAVLSTQASTASPSYASTPVTPNTTAAPDIMNMLSGIINSMGGIEGLMQNMGGINGLLNGFGATK